MMSIKQPLISIAMATYNGEKFLEKQIESIFSQTYRNIELVVSDDCSSDTTIQILNRYAKRHNFHFSINKNNLGFVKNFERAISLCRGDYIALADQDDIWHPHKLDTLIHEIGINSLICSDAELIDNNASIIAPSFQALSRSYKIVPLSEQFRLFTFRNYVTGCTAMFTSHILVKGLPFPNGIRYHDWWLALIASSMDGVKYIPDRLVQYRQHAANDTGANRQPGILAKIREISGKKNKDAFNLEIENIKSMINSGRFTPEQVSILNERLLFYTDYLTSMFHWKSFRIAYRNRNFMIAGDSVLYKLAFIASSLFA
jgi:glycosyltransferase involved in cell wall biosynthesis